jgi:antitoxin (DNA-binding transcriptional repressor) of toxin-antitoxin stability system
MKTMTATEVNDHVRSMLDSAMTGVPVALTRNGVIVAYVLPASFMPAPADDKQAVPV